MTRTCRMTTRRITSGYLAVKRAAFGKRMHAILSNDAYRREDPKELLSLAEVEFLRALTTYETGHGADMFSWAFRLIHQSIINFVRGEVRQRRIASLDVPEVMCSLPGQVQDIQSSLLLEDIFECSHLDAMERQVVTMYMGHQIPVRTIAAEIGLSRDTVCRINDAALAKIHRRFPKASAVLD